MILDDVRCSQAINDDESVVILDDAATANLACFRWLNRHIAMLGAAGIRRVSTGTAEANSSLEMAGWGMRNLRLILPRALRGNKALLRPVFRMRIFQPYCARGIWKP